MEHGAIGELIPENGVSGRISWETEGNRTMVFEDLEGHDWRALATFYGEKAIRLERVALFLTTEQS